MLRALSLLRLIRHPGGKRMVIYFISSTRCKGGGWNVTGGADVCRLLPHFGRLQRCRRHPGGDPRGGYGGYSNLGHIRSLGQQERRQSVHRGSNALQCHQDLQASNGTGSLCAYVCKYALKFSDAMQDYLFNDAADGGAVAISVLPRYKLFETEMILQLFGARFGQWRLFSEGGGKRDFTIPWPDKPDMRRKIELYTQFAPQGSGFFRSQFLEIPSVDYWEQRLEPPVKIRLRASQPLGHPEKSYRP